MPSPKNNSKSSAVKTPRVRKRKAMPKLERKSSCPPDTCSLEDLFAQKDQAVPSAEDEKFDEVSDETIRQYLHYTINYGKHKGQKTYLAIFNTEEKYFRYLVSQMAEHSPAGFAVLTAFLQKYDERMSN